MSVPNLVSDAPLPDRLHLDNYSCLLLARFVTTARKMLGYLSAFTCCYIYKYIGLSLFQTVLVYIYIYISLYIYINSYYTLTEIHKKSRIVVEFQLAVVHLATAASNFSALFNTKPLALQAWKGSGLPCDPLCI